MKAYPVKFAPIPIERLWGGHQLKSWFGAEHVQAPVGEYWLVSGHPSATSVVTNGPLAGKTLTELTEEFPEDYLGDSPQLRFPLLVKLIEARADLSVQVHPDDEYAKHQENDAGKSEAWYVLEAPESGQVVYGHQFANREHYFAAVQAGQVAANLRYEQIEPDQLVYVPARTLHALLADTVVLEIQQTSDVTYRVYDWDRVDDSGQPRTLHVEKAADVLFGEDSGSVSNDWQTVPELLAKRKGMRHERMIVSPFFAIERIALQTGRYRLQAKLGRPDMVMAVRGAGELVWAKGSAKVRLGDAFLIPPAVGQYEITAEEPLTLLRAFY